MKKRDFINVISIIGIVLVLGVIIFGGRKAQLEKKGKINQKVEDVKVTDKSVTENEAKVDEMSEVEVKSTYEAANLSMQSAEKMDKKVVYTSAKTNIKALKGKNLFIGDSRTVGLMEYGNIKNADFFANSGMSVYNVYKKKISVPRVGKVSLEKLLSKKKYDRIYVMMGINEGGYDFNKTVGKYKSLIKYIMKRQPKAKIIIQANLHVTKKRSNADKYINNNKINKFNKAISKIADKKKIIYIDANVLFDDKSGNMDRKKTADEVHPYAKYYTQWGKWIVNKTASI